MIIVTDELYDSALHGASQLSQFSSYTAFLREKFLQLYHHLQKTALKGFFNINALCNCCFVPAKRAMRTWATNVPVCLRIILIYKNLTQASGC